MLIDFQQRLSNFGSPMGGLTAGLMEGIRSDRYLAPHFRFFMREVRVVAYAQFLESYKSVTLEAMAKSFGVGTDFLDRYGK